MHTAWHRVNAVFTYFATVAAALCALTALVDVLVSPTPAPAVGTTTPAWPPASLSVREVRRLSLARGGRHEQAVLGGVTLNADLRRTFNWNTKQLFVTLRAEYETPRNALNQVGFRLAFCLLSFFSARFQDKPTSHTHKPTHHFHPKPTKKTHHQKQKNPPKKPTTTNKKPTNRSSSGTPSSRRAAPPSSSSTTCGKSTP